MSDIPQPSGERPDGTAVRRDDPCEGVATPSRPEMNRPSGMGEPVRSERINWSTAAGRVEGRRRLLAAEAEVERLREHIAAARDLVAEAYSDNEDNDSPGNMAFAILNAALTDSA